MSNRLFQDLTKAEIANQPVKIVWMHAEEFGGAGDATFGLLDGLQDLRALGFLNRPGLRSPQLPAEAPGADAKQHYRERCQCRQLPP